MGTKVGIEQLRGERINIKLLTEDEKETYRRAKARAAEQRLTMKNYTLLLYHADDARRREHKK